MFKPTAATTVREYLDALPATRRKDMEWMHDFIRQTVPALKVHFASNMIGYGSFPYKNYRKELIQWPVIALASQKQYMSIYVCALEQGKYIAEKYQHELGNVSVGRSCIRFRTVSDLNLDTLRQVILAAEKNPGLVCDKKD